MKNGFEFPAELWANSRVNFLRNNRERRACAGGVIGLLLIGCAAAAESAPPPVRWVRDGTPISVESHVAFARDPAGKAGIGDRHVLDWFSPEDSAGKTKPAFGYTTDAIWARVVVENVSGEDADAVVELSHARLSEVTWFVLDGDRVLKEVSAGLRAGGNPDEPPMRYPFIDVVLPAGAVRSIYLRVRSDTAIWMPLKISDVSGHVRHAAKRDFSDHVFVGVGAGIILLALLNAWVLRSRMFWLLAGIITGFMGYYLIFHGYYVWLGGPWQGWVNRKVMIALGLFGHWSFMSFTRVYANRDVPERWLLSFADRFGWVLLAGGGVLLVVPFRTGIYVLLGFLSVCHVLGATISFRGAAASRAWSDWVLAGVWGLVLGVVFLLFAGSFVWFPQPVEIIHLQRILMLIIFVVFFALVTAHQQSVRREEARAQRAEKLAVQSQLRALRYQLNPHFLFNTLTSIEALSRKAPERIASLVRKLSVYLRLQLKPAEDGMDLFKNEWESVRAYLDIEQVRFSDALRVQYNISDAVLNGRVPDMLLQPLAENAIKHGMPEEGFLDIRFCAEREGAKLHIRVENSGRLRQDDQLSPDSGVGLENVKERLMRLYGDAASFALREEDGTVVAEIIMPFEEGDEG